MAAPDHAAALERERALSGIPRPAERGVHAMLSELGAGIDRASMIVLALAQRPDPAPAAELGRQLAGLARLAASLQAALQQEGRADG